MAFRFNDLDTLYGTAKPLDYPADAHFSGDMMERMGLERLTGLVAFARAGSLGSFAAAARSLSITPSAVSKSIGRLEDQLGIALFNRTTRALTLTRDGRVIHEAALRLLSEAETIEQLASVARSEPSGTLRVAASFPIALHLVAPLLPKFRDAYPGLAIDLRVDDRSADMVGEGIDLAIRIGELPDSSLMSLRLPGYRLSCYAAPSYLAVHGTPKHPDELASHRTLNLRYQNTGLLFRWPFDIDGKILEMTPDAAILADSSDAIIAAVLCGAGIAMCADFMTTRHVDHGDLVPILTEFSVTRKNIAAVWSETKHGNPNVRAFLQVIRDAWLKL